MIRFEKSLLSNHPVGLLLSRAVFGMVILAAVSLTVGQTPDERAFELKLRSCDCGSNIVRNKSETWKPSETAVVICDMWDRHHSVNATRRAGELAPRINEFVTQARTMGATIIHAPSSCLNTYKNHPARKRAIAATRAANVPDGIDGWCDWLSPEEKTAYPIDQSDGGIDDDPDERAKWHEKLKAEGRNPESPWQAQIETIKIDDRDYITDNGTENWNIQEQQGIKNVLVVGVHTNMCVLGRPFGLRQTTKSGRKVALVRDLTDTMYNPAMAPQVNHFSGTDLIVKHVEKFVCPTVTSDQVLPNQNAFRFKDDTRKQVVAIIAETEYKTAETIPKFALEQLGVDFRVSYVVADPDNRNMLYGSEEIANADVLLLSVRRRALPKNQLDAIRTHISSGKPVVAIRTSSHAFTLNAKMKVPDDGKQWPEFDQDVLGGSYAGHHGNEKQTFVRLSKSGSKDQPNAARVILAGVEIEEELQVGGSLYKTSPVKEDASILLTGRIDGVEKVEPVAWARTLKGGSRVFYTSLGHAKDFELPAFKRLLSNATYWATKQSDKTRTTERQPARQIKNKN